jgi:hypothetical protein
MLAKTRRQKNLVAKKLVVDFSLVSCNVNSQRPSIKTLRKNTPSKTSLGR